MLKYFWYIKKSTTPASLALLKILYAVLLYNIYYLDVCLIRIVYIKKRTSSWRM